VRRIASAVGVSTSEAMREYTIRRGSILKFTEDGRCVALDGTRCTIHPGRPLACRLYPLGLDRDVDGRDNFVRLEPAFGSLGVYSEDGTIAEFLAQQGITEYLAANESYRKLIALLRERIDTLVDFETVEPREFWRVATREALAETNFDANPLIDALFDADHIVEERKLASLTEGRVDSTKCGPDVEAHIDTVIALIDATSDPAMIAAAAIMTAVSLGFSPRAASD
jgi:hypothetical protein